MTDDRRCGNCKWWGINEMEWPLNDCFAPVPSSLSHYERDTTGKDEGTDCPCFERKEASDAKPA